jgi:hypothetical protein
MESGTQRVGRTFALQEFHVDGKTHRNDPEIQEGYSKFTEALYDLTYCHFIRAGLCSPDGGTSVSRGPTISDQRMSQAM